MHHSKVKPFKKENKRKTCVTYQFSKILNSEAVTDFVMFSTVRPLLT